MEDIQDEEDRKDLITELGDMAKEDHTESENMIQRFKALKTDIGHFLVRFDEWFQGTGTELKQEAYDLGQGINNLTEKIEQLDEEIALTTPALLAGAAAAGPMIVLIQLIVPGTTLGSSMTLRLEQASQLSGIQRELADVNRNQQELAQIKTEFDGLKPDIALICPKLALIGEIWPAIRGQALHFRQTLMGGKEAHKNLRFKQEVQLARNLCRVVGFGLDRYAMELERRK
ncbi:unnamed protein product [Rhizoctonia solani]|uniref:Uncharacterized protein n=1 Tax=Rhizoctonia solani TaxID=456999 RepID=A0A8H3H8Q1_9AGAM|nr:unnamed protein product [Rhizoctonia solani]